MKITAPTHTPVKYRNHYCGPSAISSITGLSCECAAAWLREHTKKRSIKGVETRHLKSVLRLRGVYLSRTEYPIKRLTLNQWSKTHKKANTTYLLVISSHFVVVRGRKIYDNQEGEQLLSKSKHKRKRVNEIIEVFSATRYKKDIWPDGKTNEQIAEENKSKLKSYSKLKTLLKDTESKFLDNGRWEDGREIQFGPNLNEGGCHYAFVYSVENAISTLMALTPCDESCPCKEEEVAVQA